MYSCTTAHAVLKSEIENRSIAHKQVQGTAKTLGLAAVLAIMRCVDGSGGVARELGRRGYAHKVVQCEII